MPAEQTPATDLALRGLFAGLPFVSFLAGFFIFARFRLDHHEHARVRQELERRAGEL